MSNITTRMIICGGRHFDQYEYLEFVLDNIIRENGIDKVNLEIISGHCEGADLCGERYAQSHGIKCNVFPAEWKKYGRKAGPLRNSQMIEYAIEADNPMIVAFVTADSKGTFDAIRKANKKGIRVYSYSYAPTTLINPAYCKSHDIQIEVEQGNELDSPHVHVYHRSDRELSKCSYIKLNAAEYLDHGILPGIMLTVEAKKQFLEAMSSPSDYYWFNKEEKPIELTGHQYAVMVWVETFEEDYLKFEMDENGLPIMPDYYQLEEQK